jgi:hypothetical protein
VYGKDEWPIAAHTTCEPGITVLYQLPYGHQARWNREDRVEEDEQLYHVTKEAHDVVFSMDTEFPNDKGLTYREHFETRAEMGYNRHIVDPEQNLTQVSKQGPKLYDCGDHGKLEKLPPTINYVPAQLCQVFPMPSACLRDFTCLPSVMAAMERWMMVDGLVQRIGWPAELGELSVDGGRVLRQHVQQVCISSCISSL